MPFPCEQCQALRVNGVPCHEPGCPDAWRDRDVDCFECGCPFRPESRYDRTCPDCLNPEPEEPAIYRVSYFSTWQSVEHFEMLTAAEMVARIREGRDLQ